jgi:hypothetical protein
METRERRRWCSRVPPEVCHPIIPFRCVVLSSWFLPLSHPMIRRKTSQSRSHIITSFVSIDNTTTECISGHRFHYRAWGRVVLYMSKLMSRRGEISILFFLPHPSRETEFQSAARSRGHGYNSPPNRCTLSTIAISNTSGTITPCEKTTSQVTTGGAYHFESSIVRYGWC